MWPNTEEILNGKLHFLCSDIEPTPLICSANQWSGFYMIGTSVLKELNQFQILWQDLYYWLRICISLQGILVPLGSHNNIIWQTDESFVFLINEIATLFIFRFKPNSKKSSPHISKAQFWYSSKKIFFNIGFYHSTTVFIQILCWMWRTVLSQNNSK